MTPPSGARDTRAQRGRPSTGTADPAVVRRGPAARVVWTLVGAAVLVQIAYPLVPESALSTVTAVSVLVFALASVADAARRAGARGAVALVVVGGVGGTVVEAVGLRTGFPFGEYAYTGTLGPEVLDVPVVVGLAWTMMAWPALVVARTLAGPSPVRVALLGGAALAAWDVFLDPQMVAAGHWTWADPHPSLPLLDGIPASNFAGWLLVSVVIVGVLHRMVPAHATHSGPASALYLWVYGSSVVAHALLFGLPDSALAGGVLMGVVAVPFARALWTRPATVRG